MILVWQIHKEDAVLVICFMDNEVPVIDWETEDLKEHLVGQLSYSNLMTVLDDKILRPPFSKSSFQCLRELRPNSVSQNWPGYVLQKFHSVFCFLKTTFTT